MLNRILVVVFVVFQVGGCGSAEQKSNEHVAVESDGGVWALAKKHLEEQPQPKPQPADFLTSDQAAIAGDLRVQLLLGGIGEVEWFDSIRGERFWWHKDFLWIKIKITNASRKEIAHYTTWAGRQFDVKQYHATITDEFSNRYISAFADREQGVGLKCRAKSPALIMPGGTVEDILVFDKVPAVGSRQFTLELPGRNIGKDNTRIIYKLERSFFDNKPWLVK